MLSSRFEADADEAVTARAHALVTAAVDDDVAVPMGKAGLDHGSAGGIIGAEITERLVGKDHAPAKGIAGLVALDHQHFMAGIAQLHRDCEIETGRTATQTNDAHIRRSPIHFMSKMFKPKMQAHLCPPVVIFR